MSRAAGLAEKVLHDYPDILRSVTLEASGGGVFEVTLDDQLIFSKQQEGRFPEEDEILPKVEALRNGQA